MKKDPCEMCLVRACCIIQSDFEFWECGCGPYEIYRIREFLANPESHYVLSNNSIMIYNNRIKELKERQ